MPSTAKGAEFIGVSLDWSGVSGTVVTRCGLLGLENLLVQALLDNGWSLVPEAGPADIAVVVIATQDTLSVEARRGDQTARQSIPVPQECESTIQLDIANLIPALVQEILERMPPPPQEPEVIEATEVLELPEVAPQSQPPPEPPRAPPQMTLPWDMGVGLGLTVPGADQIMPTVTAGWRYHLSPRFGLGIGIDVAFGFLSDLLLLEAGAAAQGFYKVAAAKGWALTVGADAAVLMHVFNWRQRTGYHLDQRGGLFLEVSNDWLRLGVMPHVHRVSVEHRVRGDLAYDAGHWGVQVRAGMVLH